MKILLLHGWPVSERVWVSQVAVLRDAGFDVVAPHLYGRGPSIDDWAAQLLRELDGPLVPVGASMGGYCALALARRAPERVVGMVLVGSRADADSFDRRRFRQESIADLRAGVRPPLADGDADLEHLAVAQEAMRDRLDLTGVVGIVRRAAARMRRRPRRDRLGRGGAWACGQRPRRQARGLRRSRTLRRRRPAGGVQRGASRVPEPVEDVTHEELRRPSATRSPPRRPNTAEYDGFAGAHCDPRQGHIRAPSTSRSSASSRARVRGGARGRRRPEGAEIVAYCHVGSRPRSLRRCSSRRGTARGTTSGPGTSGRAPCLVALSRRSLPRNAQRVRDPSRSTARASSPTPRAAPRPASGGPPEAPRSRPRACRP